MGKRKLGKLFSFSTSREFEADRNPFLIHVSREELLRLIGAAVNSLNATPDANEFEIQLWHKPKTSNHHAIIYPR